MGEGHTNAKLSAMTVWEIRQRYKLNTEDRRYAPSNGQMQRWLARKFNLPVHYIKKIVYGTVWKRPAKQKSWEDWEKEHGLENGFDGGTST